MRASHITIYEGSPVLSGALTTPTAPSGASQHSRIQKRGDVIGWPEAGISHAANSASSHTARFTSHMSSPVSVLVSTSYGSDDSHEADCRDRDGLGGRHERAGCVPGYDFCNRIGSSQQ